jgi:hypothetical protein
MRYLLKFATKYAKDKRVNLKLAMSWEPPTTQKEFHNYESLYSILEVYIWLSFQLGETAFPTRKEAIEMAEKCSSIISQTLEEESQARTRRRQEMGLNRRERRAMLAAAGFWGERAKRA